MLPTSRPKLFQDLTHQEKRLFSYEELFDNHKYMKKYILIITTLITICETIKLAINPLGELSAQFKTKIFIVPVLISIGVILCLISHLKPFERKTSKIVVLRLVFLCIANMFFCAGVFLNVNAFMTLANENKDTKSWFDAITYVSKGTFITVLGSMVHPVWQLKATVPAAYFLAIFIGYLESDQDNIGLALAELLTALAYVISLFAVAEYFRYQQFIRKCESDDWKIIHGCILERVNNAIVVINPEGQVVYSNAEFDNLSKGDPRNFFAKVRQIKKRVEEGSEQEISYLNNLTPKLSIEESQINMLSATRLSKAGLMKRSVDEIFNANELIQIVNQSIQEGMLTDGTYLTFDGKFMEDGTEDVKQQRSYEISVSPLSSYNKVILIFHDTTQHARLITLETNNHYKDKLLASVSHELRTPLNGNLALLETTLNHDEVSQSVKEELLVPAYRSGKLLGYLINDILDYSQIKAEKLRMTFKSSSLKHTLMSCYQLLEIQAKAKKLDLVFEIDKKIPDNFVTDHDRVVQVILNLLSNALKFTFKGKVILKASLINSDKSEDDVVEIQVIDTGIGIKPEDTSKLFQEFMQLGGEHERKSINSKGVGLGLTIADQLVRRLSPNGTEGISVKSVFGQGSCFSFLIDSKELEVKTLLLNPQSLLSHQKSPGSLTSSDSSDISETFEKMDEYIIDAVSNKNARGSRVPSFNCVPSSHQVQQIPSDDRIFKTLPAIVNPPVSRKKGTILIVDDEPFNILALQSMLQSLGFLVDSAFNGKEAVEKVTQQYENSVHGELKYDVIFMDCQMPVMDGYEATKVLCDIMKDKLAQIPIIGCTAFTAQSKMDDCIKVGMKHVINKPVTRKGVDEILKQYVGSTQLMKGKSYC